MVPFFGKVQVLDSFVIVAAIFSSDSHPRIFVSGTRIVVMNFASVQVCDISTLGLQNAACMLTFSPDRHIVRSVLLVQPNRIIAAATALI